MELGSFMNIVEVTKRPKSALSVSDVRLRDENDLFSLNQVDECILSSAPISTNYRDKPPVRFDSLKRRVSIETNSSLQPLVPVKSSKWTLKKKVLIVCLIAAIIASVCAISFVLVEQRKSDDDGDEETTTRPDSVFQTTTLSDLQQQTDGTKTTSKPGNWISWNMWTDCSVTCGTGIHVRYRICNTTKSPADCHGSYRDIDECSSSNCPVYGLWSTWSSWSDCSVSCGNGFHTRNRQCNRSSTEDDLDCAGENIQNRTCKSGQCPDCSKTCEDGNLNHFCTMCECDYNTTGRIVSPDNTGIPSIRIYSDTNPPELLAITDSFGSFNLVGACSDTTVKFEYKNEQIVMETIVSSLSPSYILRNTIFPYIHQEPRPKARLTGENVTLCCSAIGVPNISYYEWFKDERLLYNNAYPDGTQMSLINLQSTDSGQYECRANSDIGSVKSVSVNINIKDESEHFCQDSLVERITHLPFDCVQPISNTSTIEVGDCTRRLCRTSGLTDNNKCKDDIEQCCSVSDFDMVSVMCTSYELSVLKVTSCNCGPCLYGIVRLAGTVLTHDSKTPIAFAEVYMNGEFKTFTSASGQFRLDIHEDYGSVSITIIYENLPTTNILDLSEGSTGTIYFSIYIVQNTDNILIDAAQNNTIYISDYGSDAGNAIAEIFVPAGSFVDMSRVVYSGTVNVSIAYLNASRIAEMDLLPGQLVWVNEEGNHAHLKSLGAFRLIFRRYNTTSTLSLVNELKVQIGSKYANYQTASRLYKLHTDSGYWTVKPTAFDSLGYVDLFDVSEWITIGEIVDTENVCYFNVRIYDDDNLLSEVTNTKYQIFLQVVHMTEHHTYKTYGHTFSPRTTCFQTLCDQNNGYIEIWISNFEKAADEFLFPPDPAIGHTIGMTSVAMEMIEYSVMSNDEHLGVKFVRDSDGPFYNTESSCLANSDKSHFKFYFTGKTENRHTQRLFFDFASDGDQNKLMPISQRVWYPKRTEGYRLCFVKVKLNINSTLSTLTIRVVSYGGTNDNITDEILGIREETLTSTSSVCVEYKCSGTIGHPYFEGAYDFTKVAVQPMVHDIGARCNVTSQSQDLLDASENIGSVNKTSNAFRFYSPISYSPGRGIYSATTSTDFESARTLAKGECTSGSLMNYYDNNPDVGVAVEFSCA